MIYDIDQSPTWRFEQKYRDRWCYFGSSSKQESHQVQSNAINPVQLQQYNDNYAGAQSKAASLTPYTGQLTAGFTPTQIQSQGVLSGIATDPRYAATTANAINATQGVLGANINPNITPQNVTAATVTAPTPYTAAQLAGTDLSPYTNPFQKQVIDASIAQNGYARDQQAVKDNAAATAANAFGGDRQAIQRAETTGAYDRNNQQNIASLNQANFTQAQQGALADIGSRNAASQFNNNMDFNVGSTNAGILNANRQFNSGQDLTAQQNTFANSLAAAGLKMNAAGQLEALNQADFARANQQGGILAAVGDTQQQQQQTELTNAYNAYMQGQQLTLSQQQLLNQALGLIPIEQTNTSDGTTTTKTNPGMGGVLAGLGSLAMGAATGGASLGLSGGLGLGSSILGSLTGSNAAGYGGMFGAAAPTVGQIPMSLPGMSSLSLPRFA